MRKLIILISIIISLNQGLIAQSPKTSVKRVNSTQIINNPIQRTSKDISQNKSQKSKVGEHSLNPSDDSKTKMIKNTPATKTLQDSLKDRAQRNQLKGSTSKNTFNSEVQSADNGTFSSIVIDSVHNRNQRRELEPTEVANSMTSNSTVDNQRGTSNPTFNTPNLEIPTTTLSLDPVRMDQTETITITVNEVGGAAVSGRKVEYYLSTNSTISTADYHIGNDYVYLSAYGSGTETISFKPQDISGLSPGDYYVGIRIPDESEAWTRNDQLTINPAANTSNLEIPTTALSLDPVRMDQTETITITVNEVGGAAVSGRKVEYYLSTNSTISTGDYHIGNDYVYLSAYGSGTETISFKPQDISGLSPGDYYVGIRIPDENEAWTRNDQLTITPVANTSDLEIPTIALSLDPVQMDQTETITVTVNEVGGATVSGREIEYYLSTNSTISTGDFYIGNDYVYLSANGSGTETISFKPQDISGLTPGDYYVGIRIPDENEAWTRNDQLTITPVANTPDLEVPNIALSLDPIQMDQTETITITVNEVGGAAVSGREVEYYLSTNSTISTGDFYIGNDYVYLSANGSGTETISFKPQDISGLTPGDYYVGIRIPDENEAWTRNDQLTITPVANTPDLEVPNIALSLDPVQMDQTETITITVNEVGGAAVSGREVEYYLSTNSTISTGDFYIGNDYVYLSANGSGTETISFKPQDISGLTPGDYYVGIRIPDENEAWTRNDQLTITPVANTPDLEVPNIALSLDPVQMGQTETITITVNEVGGAAVSGREIEYYLSTNSTISTGDFYIGNDYVYLSANGSGTETISFKPQDINGLTPGDYYVGIRIPDENEAWARNDILTITNISSGEVDLAIPEITLSLEPLGMNQIETITVTVNEVGGGSAVGREIRYYLSTNTAPSITYYYIGNDFVNLPANGSGSESISFTPQDIDGLAPGEYYVGVVIPDENEYWFRSELLTIISEGTNQPDIQVNPLSLTIYESSGTQGINSNHPNDLLVAARMEEIIATSKNIDMSLRHIPNELIIKFSSTEDIAFMPDNSGHFRTNKSSLNNVINNTSVTNVEPVYLGEDVPEMLANTYLIRFKEHSLKKCIAAFDQLPFVEWIDLNYQYPVSETPNDPMYIEQYYFPLMSAEEAWDIHTVNEEITVAIIDTGIDWDHPDLTPNIWVNTNEIPNNRIDDDQNGYVDDIIGWDWVDNVMNPAPAIGEDGDTQDNNPMDFNGHGTHCAGVAAAVSNNNVGITALGRGLKIMSLRAGYEGVDGKGWITTFAASRAIQYAVDNGARVINMSFGAGQALLADVVNAFNNEVVVCHAAGNSNSSIAGAIDGIPETLSIAATDSRDIKANFSNYGNWIDVSAPGVNILSTVVNGYNYLSGTSMASPLVAGLAGLILSMDPSLSAAAVMDIIVSTTDNIDTQNPQYQGLLGSGRINAFAALSEVNQTPNQSITITNNGNAPLSISNISSGANWLTVSTTSYPIQLSPQGTLTVDILINWNLVGETQRTSVLNILSNDPDESNVAVSITAVPNSSQRLAPGQYDSSFNTASAKLGAVGSSFTVNDEDISFYPNPTEDYVNIDWDNFAQATVYEISGKKLLTSKISTIDLRRLNPGVYMITLEGINRRRMTFKIIKQ